MASHPATHAPSTIASTTPTGVARLSVLAETTTPDPHLSKALGGNLEGALQIQLRAVQDILQTASAETWERRAAALEFARPKPGDFNGNATPEQLAERDHRLAAQAEQCRLHARLLRGEPLV